MRGAKVMGAVVLGAMANLGGARAQGDEVSASFSLYLTPGVQDEGARGTLPVVRDLHYAIGERNIPLYLKDSRQSIEYPYRGPRKLVFFRLGQEDGEVVRIPAGETTIPSGAKKGVLVMMPKDGGASFSVRPFWLQGANLRKGRGRVYNMSGKPVALVVDGKGRFAMRDGASVEIEGRFDAGSDIGFAKLEAYLNRERSGKQVPFKVLNRNVAIPRDDTGLFLLLPKQANYLSVVTLMADGVENPDREEELQRNLPPPGEGGTPAKVGP